jgi:hypothetical protein
MKPCESKRSLHGKHVFCGGPDPICVLCLKPPRELRTEDGETEDRGERTEDYCAGTYHHRHIFQGGECLGCGREK